MSNYKDHMCSVQCWSCRLILNWKAPRRGVADVNDNDGDINGTCKYLNKTSANGGTCATWTTIKLSVCMKVMRIYN